MTAIRVVTDHEELSNSGTVTHQQLDTYVNNSGLLVVSGAAGPVPPGGRTLTAGPGIIITDSGPGGNAVIELTDPSGSNRLATDAYDIIVWRLNDLTGSYFDNVGVSGSVATLTGSSQLVLGKAGVYDSAIEFKGYNVQTYASASSNVTPKNSDINVSAWVYPYQFMTGVVVAKNSTSGLFDLNSPIVLGLTGAFGNPFVQLRTTVATSNLIVLNDSRSFDVSTWNHFGFSLSSSGTSMICRSYLNGDYIQSTIVSGTLDYSTNGWWAVGGLPTTGNQSGDYKIADIRVANIVRNDEWWRTIYTNGLRAGRGPQGPAGSSSVVTGTWRDPGNTFVTTGSVSIDSQDRVVSQIGSDVFFFVSGSITTSSGANRKVAVFGGDVVVSGTVTYLNQVTSGNHQLLRQLIHLAGSDGPKGNLWPSNLIKDAGPQPFPTASIWWTDIARTNKIVEKLITRNGNQSPATIQWKVYDTNGVTVVESFTDTIEYSGVYELSRSRSIP